MNLFSLILKQMRQRLLSTILTIFSILLGVALLVAIMVVAREGRRVFAQTDYGFDMIVGPKASPLQIVLNTVYHIDVSPGTIPYTVYENLHSNAETTPDGKKNEFRGRVQWAIPCAVGDSYKGDPIVASTPQLFGVDDAGAPLPDDLKPTYRFGISYTFADGRPFRADRFESVIGSEVAQRFGLKVGSEFQATHGFPGPSDVPDIHAEKWKVVGILEQTHTAADRVLFIPLMSFYAITEHEQGLEAIGRIAASPAPPTVPATKAEVEEKAPYTLYPDGTFTLTLPREEWRVSAILVKARSPAALLQMRFLFQNLPDAVGVMPASTMESFFDTFLPSTSAILLLIALLVTIVAGIGILVSIYNSVTARSREIAIMRALGATRRRILAAVCMEALFDGLVGALLGLVVGHLLAAAGAFLLERWLGTGLAWWSVSFWELLCIPAVGVVALIAGAVPALKAYRVAVAENLVG